MEAKRIFRACKLQGLSLHPDALKRLALELESEPSLELENVIYALKNSIDRSKMTTSVVSLSALESALDTLLAVSDENEYQRIQVFNAFEIPCLKYNINTNGYEFKAELNRSLIASTDYRINLFRQRFTQIEQRVKRNKMFAPPAVSLSNNMDYIELSKIESLLGVTGIRRVLGMIGQDERKRFFLEDHTSRIYIDLTNATYTNGLFTINCIVLVEGEVLDDVLHVHSMGFPPPETKAESMRVLGGIDPLGMEISLQQLNQIRQLEISDHAATFIVLSDVHLDNPTVMEKLDFLFQTLEQNMVPTLFILMGNFTSKTLTTTQDLQELKDLLDEFGTLVVKNPQITEHSTFVLVPGPNDPGQAIKKTLPRHPLPSFCIQDLKKKIPNLISTTNPCRLRYYTQDFVIHRDDLYHKMQQNTIVPTVKRNNNMMMEESSKVEEHEEEEDNMAKHLVKTVIDQGHLSPLPLTVSPINWAFDPSLQLFPLPDVLILADSTEQYQLGYADVAVFHPGPFHLDFSFVLYRPSTTTTEFSRVE